MLANPTTKEHYEKYARLAEVMGIDASNYVPVGEYDKVLQEYLEDQHLNGIPLKTWDRWGLSIYGRTNRMSISELVSLCKHVTIYQFLGANPVFCAYSPERHITLKGFKQLSAIAGETWQELSKNGEIDRDIIDVQRMYRLWREATENRFYEWGIRRTPGAIFGLSTNT